MLALLFIAKSLALIFCWATVAACNTAVAVIWIPELSTRRIRVAFDYTVLVVIVSGAGMLVFGVVGWVADVVIPALVARN